MKCRKPVLKEETQKGEGGGQHQVGRRKSYKIFTKCPDLMQLIEVAKRFKQMPSLSDCGATRETSHMNWILILIPKHTKFWSMSSKAVGNLFSMEIVWEGKSRKRGEEPSGVNGFQNEAAEGNPKPKSESPVLGAQHGGVQCLSCVPGAMGPSLSLKRNKQPSPGPEDMNSEMTCVILALGRWRQEDLGELEANLIYITGSRMARTKKTLSKKIF